ncbi:MAG: cellulase family glycosylhydrolase [Spirochaetota bacterium]
MEPLTCYNQFFVDAKGAVVLLRGVNLGGSSKLPMQPNGSTHLMQNESFRKHRDVSFVGRPFVEEEAEEHFSRLQKWGFNFLRFVVTWEAIEHRGPGIYDEEYIRYLVRMIKLAEKKGFYIWIDPHQDVWSRFTGGDGAPGWTLETIGIDIQNLKHSGLTFVQHEMAEKYKTQMWYLNYQKYPTASMFTLFFAGSILAPFLLIDGQNIQHYLQTHYTKAMTHLAKKISRFKNILGFGSFNEPSPGYIGRHNLKEYRGMGFGLQEAATPFQEMFLSEGNPQKIELRLFYGKKGIPMWKKLLNPDGVSIWKQGKFCVWRMHGVWNYDPNGAPMLLRPDYFSKNKGKKIEFYRDCLKPFFQTYHQGISTVRKRFRIFIENEPGNKWLDWQSKNKDGSLVAINSSHWYEVGLLFSKKYLEWFAIDLFAARPVFGSKKATEVYEKNILEISKVSRERMQNAPTVIGETGIPMDLNAKQGYVQQDYRKHEKVLDRIYRVMEKYLLYVAIWNYTADNTHATGDNWNGEDLSIYSLDTPAEVDKDGGRTVVAFSRPYPKKTCGEPISLSFDIENKVFKYSFKRGKFAIGSCVIYIPPIHYSQGFKVLLNAGSYSYNAKTYELHFQGEKGIEVYGISIQVKD